jgi:hypothetical protein
MKESFRDDLHLSQDNYDRLMIINQIIEEYAKEGYRMTLRQLYYQLVTKNIIRNVEKEYAKLSDLLVKGRMCGIVDWTAIEDRIRRPFLPYWVDDIPDAINDTISQYRLNRQEGQEVYIEIWVEKDALSGVLRPITSHYHINLMVNRGYSSCTAMYDAFKRLKAAEDDGKETVILYLGDHDPSGLDMVRDVTDRLEEFGVNPSIHHVAITKSQIQKYNPPPNPAKVSDPRAKDYIAEHGNTSWEVDALNPKVLNQLLKSMIEGLINMDLFTEMLKKEKHDKDELSKMKDKMDGGGED